MMTTQYCTRDCRTVDASEALDDRGRLRNGYGIRAPMTMLDSIQKDVAAFADKRRKTSRDPFGRETGTEEEEEEEEGRRRRKCDAHTFTDARGITYADQRVDDAQRVTDRLQGRDEVLRQQWRDGRTVSEQARDEMIRDTASAWKVDPTPTGAGVREPVGARVGDVCMTDDTHAPGHLEMRNGALVCVADKRRDAAQDDADPRAAAYAEMVRDTDYRTRTNG